MTVDSRLVRFATYWNECRDSRAAPRREDIDPLDIPDLLPTMTLIDVLWEPMRFRYRLIGTAVTEYFGRDSTGRFVDEGIYGDDAPAVFATFARLATEARPFHRILRLNYVDRGWVRMEGIELPLVDDDGRVNMIVCCNTFVATTDTSGPRRIFEPLDLQTLIARGRA